MLLELKGSPRLSHVPIAILSSSTASIDMYRSGLQGVRYISKPSHLADFLATAGQAVKEMLHGMPESSEVS